MLTSKVRAVVCTLGYDRVDAERSALVVSCRSEKGSRVYHPGTGRGRSHDGRHALQKHPASGEGKGQKREKIA